MPVLLLLLQRRLSAVLFLRVWLDLLGTNSFHVGAARRLVCLVLVAEGGGSDSNLVPIAQDDIILDSAPVV